MRVLDYSFPTGRIYQVYNLRCTPYSSTSPDSSILFLQSVGLLRPGAVPCSTRNSLRECLRAAKGRDVIVCTISAFRMDGEVLSWLYFAASKGSNIYLLTIGYCPLPFADCELK